MAGSYKHVVEDDGQLSSGERINGMLECMSGDVVECVTEMYGMIWYLADMMAGWEVTRSELVEEARKNYHIGLSKSPGVVRD